MENDNKALHAVVDKVAQNTRISVDEGLELYHHADLLTLARLADAIRFQRHPQRLVTFVVDRNINYTNICMSGCRFCAFYKTPESGKGYVISRELLHEKIQETLDLGGTQILLQGGSIRIFPLTIILICFPISKLRLISISMGSLRRKLSILQNDREKPSKRWFHNSSRPVWIPFLVGVRRSSVMRCGRGCLPINACPVPGLR